MNSKQEYELKRKRLSFRVTYSEFDYIKKQMNKNDETITEYIRRIVVNKTTRVPSYMRAKLKVAYELNKIGNNINQLAKIAHTNGDLPTLLQLEKIEKELERIKQ